MRHTAREQIDKKLMTIYTLAQLMNGVDSEENMPAYLFHGCARILIDASTTALEYLDELEPVG